MWGDGSGYTYTWTGSAYTDPPGIFDTLKHVGSTYVLTTKYQTAYTFQQISSKWLVTSIADENGNSVTINRNSDGTLNTVTDPTGRKITFGYTTYGSTKLITSITDPLSRLWTLSYSSSSPYNLTNVYVPHLGSFAGDYIFGYGSNSLISSETDLNGNTATFLCNSNGSVAWEKDPLGHETTFTYGTSTTTVIDPNGHSKIDTYNTSGQLASTADALSHTESFTYDANNDLLTDKDRNGYTWTRTYDSNGNLLTLQSPHNAAKGYAATIYTYNAHNRQTSVLLPGKEGSVTTYNSSDDPTEAQQHDANNNVISTTIIDYPYSSGAPTNYGLADYEIDPNGNKTLYGYDSNYYLSSVTTPMGHVTSWVRNNSLDAVTQRTDADGNVTNYTLDSWLRVTAKGYTNSVYNATYGYDYNGNLTSFANYAGAYTRTYDADNRFLAEKLNGSTQLAHTYDSSGQLGLLSTTTDVTGRTITYGYTVRNQIQSISEATGEASYAYDNDENLNNSINENGVYNTVESRDENDRLTEIYDATSGGTTLQSNSFTYNADGKIIQAADNFGAVTTYGYDGLLHLNSEVRTGYDGYNRTYVVDGVGDRTSMDDSGIVGTLYHNADDEQITDPSGYRTYTYNNNGDQVAFSQVGEVPATYQWDPEDDLNSIQYSGNGYVVFAYDAIGRQVARGNGTVTTSYFYDGDKVIADLTGSTWTTDTWGPNGQVRRGTEFTYYDGLGSADGQTNAADAVTESIVYDSFGRPQAVSGGSADPFQYKSEYGYRADGDGNITGQGIYKVGARYYDPLFGRFISRDSDLSQSPYSYCDGDPINSVDPSGHKPRKEKWTAKDDEEMQEQMQNIGNFIEQLATSIGGLTCALWASAVTDDTSELTASEATILGNMGYTAGGLSGVGSFFYFGSFAVSGPQGNGPTFGTGK